MAFKNEAHELEAGDVIYIDGAEAIVTEKTHTVTAFRVGEDGYRFTPEGDVTVWEVVTNNGAYWFQSPEDPIDHIGYA